MKMEIEVSYEPSEKQLLAHQDLHQELLYGGASGGGKTYFICAEAYDLCVRYPGNRGFMGRKIGKHFSETTLVTWQKLIPKEAYHINWQKMEITVFAKPYNSTICFGGLNVEKEIDRFKSGEYGFIIVDQAEEITEQDYIDMASRLRWVLPDGTRPHYRLIFTANPKACFLRKKFILAPDPKYQHYIQALPSDNPYLDSRYIERLEDLYKYRPELLEALLHGSWDILEGSDIVIKYSWADKARRDERGVRAYLNKRGVCIDPARFGDDEHVIYAFEGTKVIGQEIYGQKSVMEDAGRCLKMCREIGGNFIAVLSAGVGGGVVDRLKELVDDKIHIMEIQEGGKADNSERYANVRAEMYWEASELFAQDLPSIPNDDVLVGQLSGQKFYYASNGKVLLIPKEDIKAELGQSPGRSDALVGGLYAIKRAPVLSDTLPNTGQTSTQRWIAENKKELAGVAQSYAELEE